MKGKNWIIYKYLISVASEINHTLRIVHSQEVPEYKKIWSIKVSKPCYDEKLFVIYMMEYVILWY